MASAMPAEPEFQIARYLMMLPPAEYARTGPEAAEELLTDIRQQWPDAMDGTIKIAAMIAEFLRSRRKDSLRDLALLHVGNFSGVEASEWAQARAYALSKIIPQA